MCVVILLLWLLKQHQHQIYIFAPQWAEIHHFTRKNQTMAEFPRSSEPVGKHWQDLSEWIKSINDVSTGARDGFGFVHQLSSLTVLHRAQCKEIMSTCKHNLWQSRTRGQRWTEEAAQRRWENLPSVNASSGLISPSRCFPQWQEADVWSTTSPQTCLILPGDVGINIFSINWLLKSVVFIFFFYSIWTHL